MGLAPSGVLQCTFTRILLHDYSAAFVPVSFQCPAAVCFLSRDITYGQGSSIYSVNGVLVGMICGEHAEITTS